MDTTDIEKEYWSHSEVAKMLDEPVSTIRFWMQEFGIEHVKGRPLRYKKGAVEKFRRIQEFVREGYKLQFIKQKI